MGSSLLGLQAGHHMELEVDVAKAIGIAIEEEHDDVLQVLLLLLFFPTLCWFVSPVAPLGVFICPPLGSIAIVGPSVGGGPFGGYATPFSDLD